MNIVQCDRCRSQENAARLTLFFLGPSQDTGRREVLDRTNLDLCRACWESLKLWLGERS